MVVYCQCTYFKCSNNNFVLTYYILVNKVNNEIHNLLQFTMLLTKNTHLYLNLNLHFSIQKPIAQVLSKLFLSTGKVLQFYISSNMAVSGNLAVDLLVIAFSLEHETFSAKIVSCKPSNS